MNTMPSINNIPSDNTSQLTDTSRGVDANKMAS
ncbi:hypothetical protein BH23THE1_BH23THE1_33420 [soil metagenome]